MNFRLIIVTSIFAFQTPLAFSDEKEERVCDQRSNIEFVINDIFDLSDPETIFLHSWANFLHIQTKPVTLLNESAFFHKKCDISAADLQELERHLRKQKYIREAIVTQREDHKIIVETFDNWSLLPTLDYSRKGGKNKYAFGIKDRNLLGLGIDAEIEYFSNNQRSGYKFDTQFPLFMNENINGSIRLNKNDDGSSEAIFLKKDFVSFATPYAFELGFDNFNQVDSLFQNGDVVSQYNHDQSLTRLHWRWLQSNNNSETLRLGLGYSQEKHVFSDLLAPTIISSTYLPQDREHNYPFVSAEYLQKDYREFTNFNLINQIEDFNLGWHVTALLGKDFSSAEGAPSAIWRSTLSKGLQTSNSGYIFFDASFDGELQDSPEYNNRYVFNFSTEYFHKFNDNWGGYLKNANTISKHPYYDQTIGLGDETGVRGYPLEYQHGTRTTQFTAEARYYPHINIYKLFELGGAAFFDAGKAFGDSPIENINSAVISSVGIGARVFSTHSSEAKVLHFDIVKPLSSDANVNNVEFRVTTKHSF